MTLDEIAKKYSTDKSENGHGYCKYYDMVLAPIRNRNIVLLEIGIDQGASIKMWQEYFPQAVIHAIDLREAYEYLHDGRTFTHVVDQSNKADLICFAENYPHGFDVVIDDGSHQSADMILTFETLFPYVESGGLYIIEDLLCDYDARWNKGVSVLDRIKQMISEVNMGGNIPNDHICANKHEAVKKYHGTYFEKNIEWFFAACGTVIIKKI